MNQPLMQIVNYKRTPLYDWHVQQGAKIVPFAGYDMPLHYKAGILQEHVHTRAKAGLFDVSHMGQWRLRGAAAMASMARLVPADIMALKPLQQKYSFFTNEQGGVLDDLMLTLWPAENDEPCLGVVVNAACAEADAAHVRRHLPHNVELQILPDALLALQGPMAQAVLAELVPQAASMPFMSGLVAKWENIPLHITRSGYTGEDGYEISLPAADAVRLATRLCQHEAVMPIGLGARDSLRLEAGLCLYGHELDSATTPIEAGLLWAIPKNRRVADAGYLGASVIAQQCAGGVMRKRVGLQPLGRGIAREGAPILSQDGQRIGVVSSGGFAPSLQAPIAMGFVGANFAALDTEVQIEVRGQLLPAKIVTMPFVPSRYFKSSK